MKRKFLAQFIEKLSDFPIWAKEIILNSLANSTDNDSRISEFVLYKPILTYKGRCELSSKKFGFDTNIYNFLSAAEQDFSISEIIADTYLSLEEASAYLIFCIDEALFEIPDNSHILNIAGLLAGKYRTGEFFINSGVITKSQCDEIIQKQKSDACGKKFGQYLVDSGFISKSKLNLVLKIKQEAQKRFILDYNDIPKTESFDKNIYQKQIDQLQEENQKLKTQLNNLLTIVRNTNE